MNTSRRSRAGLIVKITLGLVLLGGIAWAWRWFAPEASSYVRLWEFKESLGDPQKTTVAWTRDGLTVRFTSPGVALEDFLQLGLRPIPVATDPAGPVVSKLELTRVGSDQRRIPVGEVRLEWIRGRLTALTFPAELGQFLSPATLQQYLAVISRSKIDFPKKSSYLPRDHDLNLRPLGFPSREQVLKVFGPPRRATEKIPLAYDTYELGVKGVGDVPKVLRADLYYQAWSGVFKHGQVIFAGFGFHFDEAGIVVKR